MRSEAWRGGWLAALALAAALTGCYDGEVAPFHDAVVIGREDVTALAVSGDGTVIELDAVLQIVATATTPTGTVDISSDVNWTSSNPAAVTVDTRGRVKGIANGSATITATLGPFSASAVITASDAALTGIVVSGAATIDECGTGTYTASGHYDDGTDRDITSLVSWSVTDSSIGRMSTLGADRNTLLGKLAGSTGVIATRSGIDSPAFAVAVADTLTALVVTPAAPSQLAEGDTLTFVATGTWGATSANVSRAATWTVVNDDTGADDIASVANGDSNPGRLTAESGGTGTLTASCGGLDDDVAITVVFLDTLAITNTSPITLAPNANLLLVLEGTYSDGSKKPLNESATWTVTSGTTVTVSNVAGSRGRVTAGADTGTSTVQATVDGKTASVLVTVQ